MKGKMGQNEWQKKIEEAKKHRWKLIKVAMLHLVARDMWRGLKSSFFAVSGLPEYCPILAIFGSTFLLLRV